MLKKTQWIKAIMEEIRKHFEMNENKNTVYRNLWHTAKVMLAGQFVAINANIKKEEPKSSNLKL